MLDAFRSPAYARFWIGSFASNVGTWIQSVALGWLVYDMTRSASSLGIISFAGYAPALVIGPLAGAVADRVSYRKVLILTQTIAAAGALVLATLTASGSLEVWHVIAIAVAAGIALTFYMPVAHSLVPVLVPPNQLLNAISLNSVNFNLARITGPLIAGFAYGAIGPAGCFAANAFSFLALVAIVWRLDLEVERNPPSGTLRSELREGLRYAREDPLIVSVLVLAAGISLFGFPYIVLMPAVARDVLHLGPEGLGFLMGAIGAGAVVGGLGLASMGDVSRKALLAVTSAGGFSGFLVLFSQATTQRVALVLLFLLGMTQVICVASLNTTLQVRVSDAMRGRIMSLITLCFFGLSTLGSLILGWIGDQIGIARALGGGGLAITALAAIIVVWRPAMYAPVRPRESVVSSR